METTKLDKIIELAAERVESRVDSCSDTIEHSDTVHEDYSDTSCSMW